MLVALGGTARAQEAFRPDKLPEGWAQPEKADATPAAADAAKAAAAATAELTKLLGDDRVTLVRVGGGFLPGRDGQAPKIHKGPVWLAYKSGEILGAYPDPEKPLEVPKDQVKARTIDFAAEHPRSFAMPGLCDADSRWFVTEDNQTDLSVDAADHLETWQEGWRELPERAGITAVFVPASTAAQASGAGAIVSLDLDSGPKVASKNGPMFFRLATLETKGSNLTRADVVKGLRAFVEATKKYKEAQDKWKKDLEEYKKKRKEFLEYYKKNPMKPGDENERKAAPPRAARRGRPMLRLTPEDRERIGKLPPAERMKELQRLANEQSKKRSGAAADGEKKPDAKPDAKGAPPRPKYPKEPDVDRAKEAMLRVLDGKASLRVEAHRAAEILSLLEAAKELELGRLTLVGATEAWKVATELRHAGATVVLTPQNLPEQGFATLEEHLARSAAKLCEAGVPVAFGSGATRQAALLPLYAARAVASGMPEEQALQALSQNATLAAGKPSQDTGLVVFSHHPLSPDARVLAIADPREVKRLGGKK